VYGVFRSFWAHCNSDCSHLHAKHIVERIAPLSEALQGFLIMRRIGGRPRIGLGLQGRRSKRSENSASLWASHMV
jgi:hypothetical protein